MAHPASYLPFDVDDEPVTQRVPFRVLRAEQIDDAGDEVPPTLRSARGADVARSYESMHPPPSVEVIEQSGLRPAMSRSRGDDEWLDDAALVEEASCTSSAPPDTDPDQTGDTDPAPPPTMRSEPPPAVE